MKKSFATASLPQRLIALALVLVMVLGYLPAAGNKAAAAEPGTVTTVADPQTLTRPDDIYGDNTLNTGKVTVGKSVHDGTVSIPHGGNTYAFAPEENNFIVTISQSAQVTGKYGTSSAPVDVVLVLDTSGSMNQNGVDRASSMVTAANSAIAALMAANENNRVAVVAFSSDGYGGGTSGNAAASVLSSLKHYSDTADGNAATEHLRWVASDGEESGNSRNNIYIAGRDTVTRRNNRGETYTVDAYRNGHDGGTNIQAGIIAGAQILTSVTDTVYTNPDTQQSVKRIPFLIILSDGQPTFSSSDEAWYDPSTDNQQGPGSDSYEGNGFLAALTAAYYKGKITEHYYGDQASEVDRCYIYTMGVQIESLDDTNNQAIVGDNQALAELTLNPAENATGENNYWQYGNTWNDQTKDASFGWETYWENFLAEPPADYQIRVDELGDWEYVWTGEGPAQEYYRMQEPDPREYYYRDGWSWVFDEEAYNEAVAEYEAWQTWVEENFTRVPGSGLYTITADSIAAASKYVESIAYNDDYFSATDVADMEKIFNELVRAIEEKSISAPTHVDAEWGNNFSGYVHFSDPIGEYMEIKDMKGILAGGYLYEGKSFAQRMQAYGGTGEGQDEFDAMFRAVLEARMLMSSSTSVDLDAFLAAIKASGNQAYYNSDTDYNNSIVWWGSEEIPGTNHQVQVLGHADDDSISYIEQQKTAGTVPAGAAYVCRSYFFYGEAGGANPNPDHEYLYFMVRVQRSLEAPYQQTVIISAPASLLSVEEVMITENTDGTFSATVKEAEPARVVYEVGLRSDINAQNVMQIVSADYAAEKPADGIGSVNYDPVNNTYNFFTNDWDRQQAADSHHRALTEANFHAAADNPFYTYQEDTLLLDANGNPVASGTQPSGTYYYARTYYDWSNAQLVDGVYVGVEEKTELIKVEIPTDIQLKQDGENWYIPAYVFTASTLQVSGDDTVKSENATGTSEIVAHPHRTGDASDSHYSVDLGNNGMLSLVADPAKSVENVTRQIVDADGNTVMVGDILTYRIKVVNNEGAEAEAVVTDKIPAGTALVEGSISHGGTVTDGVITWNLELAKDETIVVEFQVEVLPEALSGEGDVQNINNTAVIQIGNDPAYNTNTTSNPPEGKKVVGEDGTVLGDVQVGTVLTYRIRFYNDQEVPADITITDIVPAGTTFLSADHNGVEENGTITWKFEDVAPGTSGVVSFDVVVDASAVQQPGDEDIVIRNNAAIQIGDNDPRTTNETETTVKSGSVSVTKVIAETDAFTDRELAAMRFTVVLTDSTGKLNGEYDLYVNGVKSDDPAVFVDGVATLTIAGGQTIKIDGIPEGTVIYVEETGLGAGWVVRYADNDNGRDPQRVVIDTENTELGFTLTNSYHVKSVVFQLKGSKAFEGTGFPAGSFTFNSVRVDENGNALTGADAETVTATVTALDDQSVSISFAFSPREFVKEEIRYYIIDESSVSIPGVTTDGKQYMLKLEIVDENAQLVVYTQIRERANANSEWGQWRDFNWQDESVQFTNSYAPKETTISISGTKNLTGRYLVPGEFSFLLIQGDETIATTTNTGGGASSGFAFADITITAEMMEAADTDKDGVATFTYVVREVRSGPANVTYDTAVYEIVITIEDINGELKETGRTITKYTPNDAGDGYDAETVDGISFTNRYQIQDTKVDLFGSKTLTGPAAEELPAERFTFIMYEADADYVADTTKIVAGVGNAAGVRDGDDYVGGFHIGLTYDASMLSGVETSGGYKTKTFYYVVKEVIPAVTEPSHDPNMNYDETEYLIAVEVKLNVSTGELTSEIVSLAKRTGSDGEATPISVENGSGFGGLDFTNRKNPATVEYRPVGNKVTTGTDVPETLKFSFRVIGLGTDKDALVLGSVEATGISRGVSADTGDVIDFTALNYDADDVGKTFYYLIEEATTVTGNMVEYDDTQYILAVTVSRDPQTNALVATPVYYVVNEGGSATNANDWTLIPDAGETGFGDDVDFENTYDAYATLDITGTKELTGNRELGDKEFDFRLQLLKENDGSYTIVPGYVVDGVNAADGSISFGTLIFTDEQMTDDFLYTVVDVTDDATGEKTATNHTFRYYALASEIEPATAKIPGVDYSDELYIVTIEWTVTVPVDTGVASTYGKPEVVSIHAAVNNNGVYTVTGEDLGADGMVFTNVYEPTSTSVTFTAKKTLSGRDLEAGEFSFELYRGDVLVAVAANDRNGVISFTRVFPSNISADYFTGDSDGDGDLEATFVYTLKEVRTDKGGVTYSQAEYTITVVIEHDTDTAALHVMSVTWQDKEGNVIQDGEDEGTAVDGGEIVFANTYATNETSFTPTANKTVLGAGNADRSDLLAENTFSFQVYELDEDGNIIQAVSADGKTYNKVISTGTSNADGTVTFSPIGYALGDDGVHIYQITEMPSGNATITKDPLSYYVRVVVEDDGNGNLTVTDYGYYASFADAKADTNPISAITFVNHYGPGYINLVLDVDKTVTVSGALDYELRDSQFDFLVYNASDVVDGVPKEGAVPVTTGSNDAGGNIIFGSITVSRSELVDNTGVFEYVILEEVPSDAAASGITTDPEPIYVTVTVTDDGYGNLTATYVYTKDGKTVTDPVFVNEYEADPAEYTIAAHKTLTGKDLKEAEFTFKLVDKATGLPVKDKNGNDTLTSNDASGNVVFELNYLQEGTYTYLLIEQPTSTISSGEYTFDPAVYEITVVVSDDTKGNLYISSVTRYLITEDEQGNEIKTPVTALEFHNTFTPDPLVVDLTTEIGGTKTVVDAAGNVREDLVKTETFRFEVRDIQNNLVSSGESVWDEAAGKAIIDLDDFTFTEAGEYHYWIYEADTEAPYTKDEAIYEIHILVRKNTSTQVLEIKDEQGQVIQTVQPGALYIIPSEVIIFPYNGTAGTGDTEVEFVNKYEPAPVTVTLTAGKTLTGRVLNAGEFTFHLVETIDGVDYLVGEAVNDASGNITFTLYYNVDGVHTYSIHEHVPSDENKVGGVTYDDANRVGVVTVTVVEENGSLVAKVGQVTGTVFDTGVTFVNKYNAKDVTAGVEAGKVLTGMGLTQDAFEFELVDAQGNVVATARNDARGKVWFDLHFDETMLAKDPTTGSNLPTTFIYTMREVQGDAPGVSYDENDYEVAVTVYDDYQGNLYYTVDYDGDAPVFNNRYETADLNAVVEAGKTLTGMDLTANAFTFELVDEDGTVVATAKNDAQGKIKFVIPYTQDMLKLDAATGNYMPTEFHYVIREVKGDNPGITYDAKEYKVVVTVSDNYEGELTYTVEYEDGEAPVFENVYATTDAKATVEAAKDMTGRPLRAEEFEFQLLDKDGKVVATAKNDADGKVKFELTFTAAGEYVYTLVEKAGDDSYVSYDATKYTVTVKVTDDGMGTLTAAVTYGTTDGKAPTFNNRYTPGQINTLLTADKKLTGRAMQAEEFEFQLLDKDGKVVATAKNTADGKVQFNLTYTAAGEHTYTMVEKTGSAANVTYDTAKYTVTVKVTDDGKGTLTAAVTYGTTDGKAPVFTNTYVPDSVSVALTATKKLTGRALVEGEFKFQVHDSNGNLVATGTNAADGKIVFTDVELSAAGTYSLTVSEVKGTDKHITYDQDTFKVTVVVKDENGVLKAEVSYPTGSIVFENSYVPSVTPDTGDKTPVSMLFTLMLTSAFAACAMLLFRPRKGGKYAR